MSAGLRRGGGGHSKAAIGWWGATVSGAVQSSGKTVSQDESYPTPNRYPSSHRRHMEEKKNTEKKRKTQKQERFSLAREENERRTIQTDDVVTARHNRTPL